MSDDPFLTAMQEGGRVKTAADAAQVEGWVHTGNYALNWAISNRLQRGWPLGHVAEIFGPNSTGKSFVIARAISEVQRMGGLAVLDDTEGALNPDWAESQLGIRTDQLLYTRSHTVEEHYDLLKRTVAAWEENGDGRPVVIALDSLAVLTTDQEVDQEFEKRNIQRAATIKKLFRLMGREIHERPILYLMANHTIANIGARPWESKKTTPGGGGPKFEASVRLDMRTTKKIGSGGDYEGVIVKPYVDKNRVAAPFRQVEISIPFARPINQHSGLIPVLLDLGVLDTAGNHNLTLDGEDTGIPGHKTSRLKQDESAAELLEKYPDLPDRVDDMLAEREVGGSGE